MKLFKKPGSFWAVLVSSLCLAAILVGCDETADERERQQVNNQQDIYNQAQPIPRYDWSLARHLWIQFYDSQNKQVTTFSYITPITGGQDMFSCPSMGYAIPRDTQLTNPHQVTYTNGGAGVIDQAEPNGLFTSPNTDATIIFCLNDNGTVAPVYTEMKVTGFPFPVKWEVDSNHPQGHWVRVGQASNIELNPAKPATAVPPSASNDPVSGGSNGHVKASQVPAVPAVTEPNPKCNPGVDC